MAISERAPVVGVFQTRRQAGRAVHELRAAGFRGGQVGVAVRERKGKPSGARDRVKRGTHVSEYVLPAAAGTPEDGTATAADKEPVANGSLGGVLGNVLKAVALATESIPEIGPVIAGGLLAGVLDDAPGGGMVGTLSRMGVSANEAVFCQQHFQAGRTVVLVRARGRRQEAAAILHRCGALGGRIQ